MVTTYVEFSILRVMLTTKCSRVRHLCRFVRIVDVMQVGSGTHGYKNIENTHLRHPLCNYYSFWEMLVCSLWIMSCIKFYILIRIYRFLILLRTGQVNISLIVNDSEAEQCVRALHSAFFETNGLELDGECISQNGSVSAGHTE